MKILHVIRDLSPETGGPVAAIHGLSAMQRQNGDEVSIVSTDYGLSANDRQEEGVEICTCTYDKWRYAPTMAEILNHKLAWCDVVHIHTLWEYPTLLAVRLARKMSKPFLLRPCGMLDGWSMSQSRLKKRLYLRLFGKTLFAPPCHLHFTTQEERKKSKAPFDPGSVVIENGISVQAFTRKTPDVFFECFPELKNKRIVLFLGRLHPKKRPDIAIRAFSLVAPNFPDSVLVLAGPYSEEYHNELAAIADRENIGERVCFIGMLKGNELYGAYRAATVFVLPSMQENFGIAVAEAMAASCPVIISEHVDIRDYIEKGNAGIVCPVEVDQFANALERILGEPELGLRMGANAREVAMEYFTWSRAAEKLDQVYEKLIQ